MQVKQIRTPLVDEQILELRAGDAVEISGVVLTARDAAHQRMIETLERGEPLPVDLEGQVIYYVGPAPARPGAVIGSAGPTTSGRMDRYAPALHAAGLKGTIGKGYRSEAVKQALVDCRGVYFSAVGGSGALLAKRIVAAEVIAYPDLGTEAIWRLQLDRFPAIVVNDAHGGDLYVTSRERYRV